MGLTFLLLSDALYGTTYITLSFFPGEFWPLPLNRIPIYRDELAEGNPPLPGERGTFVSVGGWLCRSMFYV